MRHLRPFQLLLAILLCLSAPRVARAQDSTAWGNLKPSADSEVVMLRLRDGSTLVGRIVSVSANTIRFATSVGEVDVPRAAIAEVRFASKEQVHEGELWPDDPSATRLFFAPTGRALKQGEGYFADAYIFLPSFQYGVTDRFTIGAGFSIIPGIGLDEQLYYLTPKVNVYSTPTVNLSLGALVAGVKGLDASRNPFGILYGVSTFGGTESSFSLGGGLAYAGGHADNSAVIMAGGSTRTSRNISLVTENYYYTGASGALMSGGVRFMGEKLSVDLAGFVPITSSGGFVVMPYVAFLYHF